MVLARFAANRRLGDALHQQAHSALTSSPGAGYDAIRNRKISHHAAPATADQPTRSESNTAAWQSSKRPHCQSQPKDRLSLRAEVDTDRRGAPAVRQGQTACTPSYLIAPVFGSRDGRRASSRSPGRGFAGPAMAVTSGAARPGSRAGHLPEDRVPTHYRHGQQQHAAKPLQISASRFG